MIIKLDGATFEIDEDSSSVEFIDKIVRIMRYMTYSDVVIAKGLTENLLEMSYNNEVEKVIKEDFEEFFEGA